MTKKGAKKRIVITPNFLPQVPMLDTPALKELAKEKKLDVPQKVIPRERKETLEQLGGHFIMRQRQDVARKNIGKFYVHLFQAMYEGEILRRSEMPLFLEAQRRVFSDTNFYPDIVINGDMKTTYVEVKSSWTHNGQPWFGSHQFAGYCRALLENPGSEMITGIFNYKKKKEDKLYTLKQKGNDHLVEVLGHSTTRLLVIPHNLLTFLLMIAPSREMDRKSSGSSIEFEFYKRPFSAWISSLHNHWKNPSEAVKEILKHAQTHWCALDDEKFKVKDFFLEKLATRQYEKNHEEDKEPIYCSRYKIGNEVQYRVKNEEGRRQFKKKFKPFLVTEYKNLGYVAWMKYFREDLDRFLEGLGIREIYDYRTERIAIKKERIVSSLPKKPDDVIPI